MAKSDTSKTGTEHEELIKQLVALLDGGQAHATFADAVLDFPAKLRGVVPEGLPYSAWQLLEHMRLAPDATSSIFLAANGRDTMQLKWRGRLPGAKRTRPVSAAVRDHSIAAVDEDLEKFKALMLKPDADLVKPFRWGTGQNLLREALLIADHQAYHIGELIVLRRLLGAWHA